MEYTYKYELLLPKPVSNNIYYRHRYTPALKRVVVYMSAQGKAYKRDVHWMFKTKIKPLDGELAIGVTIHPHMTVKGYSSKVHQDLDNYLKCLIDSLQGLAYKNDKQIVRYDYIEFGGPIKGGAVTVKIREV